MPTIPKDDKLADIKKKFEVTAFRLTQERSDFLLPQIIDFVQQKKWINLRPEYQRRLVWDATKRSAFIESLLLNVPIPTLFLFERELSRYEVMDGQQRINAVVEFYSNKYALKRLENWTELNGFKYEDLPEVLQRGLDRRRLSATVVVLDSAKSAKSSSKTENDVRKMVFERLNTGGQHLNPQELRNCLYEGEFNNLLVRLAKKSRFRQIWGIVPQNSQPSEVDSEIDEADATDSDLGGNKLYSRMIDCEIVLRFFAFLNAKELRGSVKSILDNCMERNSAITKAAAATLEKQFDSRLKLAHDIFGDHTFRYKNSAGQYKISRPLYDAVMVAIDSLWDRRADLLKHKAAVVKSVDALLSRSTSFAIIVGRPNTVAAIQKRISLLRKAIDRACM